MATIFVFVYLFFMNECLRAERMWERGKINRKTKKSIDDDLV